MKKYFRTSIRMEDRIINYWEAKDEFSIRFKSIRIKSGLSLHKIAYDNMMEISRLRKIENRLVAINHDEFTMLVWYMNNISCIKDLLINYKMAIKTYRSEIIPEKYLMGGNTNNDYYKQGHIPSKILKRCRFN